MKKRKFADGGSVPDMNTAIALLNQGDKAGAQDVLRQLVGLGPAPSVPTRPSGGYQLSDVLDYQKAGGSQSGAEQMLRDIVGLGASAAPTMAVPPTPVIKTPPTPVIKTPPTLKTPPTPTVQYADRRSTPTPPTSVPKPVPMAAPARSAAYDRMVANRQQVMANRAKAPVKFAKGGSVSSRGDGCAQRGKTKGRMV